MTSTPVAGVLDTSVFIATESGRQLDDSLIPEEVATTVVTLAELHTGVLAAKTSETRAQRLATLEAVADIETLPVDDEAARMWARLRIHLLPAAFSSLPVAPAQSLSPWRRRQNKRARKFAPALTSPRFV